jgi:hypothetical protein
MITELWFFVQDVDLISSGPLGGLGLLILDPVWDQGVHQEPLRFVFSRMKFALLSPG